MYSTPIGFLFTWTCYGTWLHGDARGWVDSSHNQFGDRIPGDSPTMLSRRREALSEPVVVLSNEMRAVVDQSIRTTCSIRKWGLGACNVRTTHVHVVVSTRGRDAVWSLEHLKAWATRGLVTARQFDAEKTIWTVGGSTRYLFDEVSYAAAVHYVLHEQ